MIRHSPLKNEGFTLLELLVAVAMFAIIALALHSVFFGALRLRERAHGTFETRLQKDAVMEMIRKDLASTVAPVGILAGALTGEKGGTDGQRLDRLEFHTATGSVDDSSPWGDIQRVEYALVEPDTPGDQNEWHLVRNTTRNLLAPTEQEPEQQRLLRNISSLWLEYYDGEQWQDSWDSTARENELPLAIRLQLQFLSVENRTPMPVELVVPVSVRALVSQAPAIPGAALSEGSGR